MEQDWSCPRGCVVEPRLSPAGGEPSFKELRSQAASLLPAPPNHSLWTVLAPRTPALRGRGGGVPSEAPLGSSRCLK